jgi:short subunit dehydrogenase-like uncharacterized protein
MPTGTSEAREFEVVLWGATGFTGRLVAAHLHQVHGDNLAWAVAGRDASRLEALRRSLNAPDLPLIVADSHDEDSLAAMARRTRVVCSTVGPYARHGSELVAACVRSATDYCDITGEVQWIRRMIDAHQEEARRKGARLVHCCGFDSIPSDLGVLFLHNAVQARGKTAVEIRFRVRRASGGFSGGTIASLLNVLDEGREDHDVGRVLADPYGLNPEGERSGLDGPD